MHIKYLFYVLIDLTNFRIKVGKPFSLRAHNKNELDKNLSLSIYGLAPSQSQVGLFLDKLYARKQTKGRQFKPIR